MDTNSFPGKLSAPPPKPKSRCAKPSLLTEADVPMNCRHVCSRILFFSLIVAFALPVVCAAQQPPAPRVVELTAPDGVILKATFFAAAQPGPGVLLLHQCNRQRKVWDDLARQLAAAGINVLTFDQRGYGESEGEPYTKLNPQQREQIEREKRPGDIETAFQYLLSQPGVNRNMIGVGG